MYSIRHIVALATAVMALAACETSENARVTVVYDQVANFGAYKLSPDASSSTGAGLNRLWVQYRIVSIANTGSEATSFSFDRNKILTVTSDGTINDGPSGENILLGAELATGINVAPGQTASNVGCIIKTFATNDPAGSMMSLVDLLHQVNSDQPVTMKRAASDSSTAAVGDALPSVLQNLC
jgi:hypothetical protein